MTGNGRIRKKSEKVAISELVLDPIDPDRV